MARITLNVGVLDTEEHRCSHAFDINDAMQISVMGEIANHMVTSPYVLELVAMSFDETTYSLNVVLRVRRDLPEKQPQDTNMFMKAEQCTKKTLAQNVEDLLKPSSTYNMYYFQQHATSSDAGAAAAAAPEKPYKQEAHQLNARHEEEEIHEHWVMFAKGLDCDYDVLAVVRQSQARQRRARANAGGGKQQPKSQ